MRDKYQQAKFEQYSEQLGYGDFEEGEPDDDGRARYRNPNTQGRWNFWVASRDALALQPSASVEPVQEDPRKEAADALLRAAHDFWSSERKAGQYGAVKWLLADDGSLVIFTRGEYRHQLMKAIGGDEDAEHHFAPPPVTAALEQEASATGAEPDGDKITEALENYRCANFQDEDGGLPLSDALAAAFGDKDIGRATQEIQLIADAVWEALATPTTRVRDQAPMIEEEAVSLGRIASTSNTYNGGRFLTALFTRDALIRFVRAIEASHGIGTPEGGKNV